MTTREESFEESFRRLSPTTLPKGIDSDADFDEDDSSGRFTRTQKTILIAAIGLYLLPLVLVGLSSLMNWGVRFLPGTKPIQYAIDPILYLIFYGTIIHMALAVPMGFFALPQIKNFPYRGVRFGFLFVLIAAPLLSYAYFRAGRSLSGGTTEILLAILPAASIAVYVFERTERPGLLTAFLTVGTYLPLFVINDLLGPFSTYLSYASSEVFFYTLRAICGGMCFGSICFLVARDSLTARSKS